MLAGFFSAAVVTVQQADSAGLEWQTISWGWYTAFFLVGAVGVVILRITARSAQTQIHKIEDDLRTIESSLGALVETLDHLNAQRDDINVYDVHGKIDATLMEPLNAFVDARESLIHAHGLQPYANLMSEFANSERNINRSWSASVDGYIDEVWMCMAQAQMHMKSAHTLYQQYAAASKSAPTP